jgi:aromatic ring-cleaving dioxygenase
MVSRGVPVALQAGGQGFESPHVHQLIQWLMSNPQNTCSELVHVLVHTFPKNQSIWSLSDRVEGRPLGLHANMTVALQHFL